MKNRPLAKRKHPTVPAYICGKIAIEFFGNDDENFKTKALKDLCKGLHKDFHIAATPFDEHFIENPEQGALVFAITALSLEQGNILLDKVLAYIDTHCPGRIVDENIVKEEFV